MYSEEQGEQNPPSYIWGQPTLLGVSKLVLKCQGNEDRTKEGDKSMQQQNFLIEFITRFEPLEAVRARERLFVHWVKS